MPTILPKDSDNIPMYAMRFRNGGAHAINVTNVSGRNATAFNQETKIISLYATGPVYLRFGSGTVTATAADHYFPAGVYLDVSIGGSKTERFTHVAALRASHDCQLHISEKE